MSAVQEDKAAAARKFAERKRRLWAEYTSLLRERESKEVAARLREIAPELRIPNIAYIKLHACALAECDRLQGEADAGAEHRAEYDRLDEEVKVMACEIRETHTRLAGEISEAHTRLSAKRVAGEAALKRQSTSKRCGRMLDLIKRQYPALFSAGEDQAKVDPKVWNHATTPVLDSMRRSLELI